MLNADEVLVPDAALPLLPPEMDLVEGAAGAKPARRAGVLRADPSLEADGAAAAEACVGAPACSVLANLEKKSLASFTLRSEGGATMAAALVVVVLLVVADGDICCCCCCGCCFSSSFFGDFTLLGEKRLAVAFKIFLPIPGILGDLLLSALLLLLSLLGCPSDVVTR